MAQYTLQSLNTKTNAVAKKALLASGKSSVKAQFGLQYQVVDAETGRAPRKQVLKKKGKDLIVEVDGEQVAVIRSFYEDSSNKEAPTYRVDEICAEDGKSIEDSKSEEKTSIVVGGTAEGSAHSSGDGIVYHEDAALCIAPYVDPTTIAGEGLSQAQLIAMGLGALLVGGGATAIAVSGGNSGGSGGSSAPRDTTAPSAPAVAIPEATSGVNATEAANGVQLTVSLPNDAAVGDVVTTVVHGPNGAAITLTHTLTVADIASHSIVQTVPYSTIHPSNTFLDGNWATSTTITDPAGNVSPAMADTFVLAANAPVITIGAIATDDIINAAEALGAIPVTGTTSAEPGQTVTITLNGRSFTGTVQPDGTYTIDIPAAYIPSDGNYTITADVSSASGTPAVQAQHPIIVDTTAPVITITSIAGDGITSSLLNGSFDATERGALNSNTVTTLPVISGTTDAEAGQIVTITLHGQVYTATVQSGGAWSVTVPNADALLLNHGSLYDITATVSDVAGNSASDIDNKLRVNIAPPDVPTVVEQFTANHTPTIAGRAMKQISVDANNQPIYANLNNGDELSVTVNGVTYNLTVGQISGPVGLTYSSSNGTWSLAVQNNIPNGNYEVAVSVTAAGVTKSDISSTELHINDVPPAITLNPISDGVINQLESTQSLPVSGTTDAPVGSTVTVTINGQDYTATVQTGGVFTVTVPGTDVAALVDGTQTARASVTNQYGVTGVDTENVLVDTTPPAAPVADVAATSDTGISNTDNNTADTTPTITGTGTPGDTITVLMQQTGEVLTVTVASNGTWSVTPTQALPEGPQNASVTATDPAGNVSAPTLVPIIIDTTAPAAPAADVAASSDTGSSNTDNVTSDNTPTISGGSATPGDTITVVMPGTGEVLTAVVAQDGTWSVTPTRQLADGPQNVTVTATDPAGNVSAPTQVPVTIDTTPPVAPVADVAASSDTGISNTDNITSDRTPTISGTGSPGDTITVTFPTGEVLTTTVAQDGSWSVTPVQSLSNGPQNVSVTATDPAGNVSAPTTVPVTIDTTPPNAPVADVAASSDTGASNTDNITSDNTPTIAGTGVPGHLISVTMPGTNEVVTAIVDSNGNWSATPTQALPAGGPQNVSVTATDPAGNVSPATQVPVTIDTTPPAAPAADVAASSDTGSSNTDNITSDTTPTISGSGATPGDKITVTMPGTGEVITTTVDQNGNWSATPTQALPAGGPQNVSVTATDPAGNVSPATQVPVTIDTTPPAAPAAVLAPASDSGVAGDGITNDTTPTISGTGTPGDKITVTMPGTGEVITTTVDQNGNWSATPTQALPAGGPQNVSVTATDPAGNVSPATQVPVTIDTTPPAAPAADVAASSDTGSSNTDNITSDTTPTISGTGTPGDKITVTTPTGEVITTTVDQNGNWSATPTQALPAGGPQNVSVTATDPAGNVSPATQVPVTIDTTAPVISITSIAGDGITSSLLNGTFDAAERGALNSSTVTTRPIISGTTDAEAGQTVTITLNGQSYTATVQNGGTWSYTLSDVDAVALQHGNTYAITATVSDKAGNTSRDLDNGLVVNIAPPDVPTVVSQYTANHTPTITGAAQKADPNNQGAYINLESGDQLTVTVHNVTYQLTIGQTSAPTGLTYDATNGTWSLLPSASIANGTYEVAVSATAGGITKTDISASELHINDAAPQITLSPISAGTLNAAEHNQQLPISGTTDAAVGETVTVTLNGRSYTAIVQAGANGQPNTFVVNVPAADVASIADGTQTATASVTNQFGVTATDTENLLVDTTAPAAPAADVAASSDTGSSNTDNITSDTTPTISGSGATPGDKITVTMPGTGEVITTTVDQNGNWSATPTQALPAGGPQNVSVTATDPAGNVSPATQVPVTIDTTPPAAPAAVLAPASDSGVAGDGITNDTTPTISGTGTPGDTITVTTPTGEVITTTVDQNGNWSATPTQALPAGGPQNVSVTATDPAGNVSPATQVPVTIDTTPPAAPAAVLAPASDSGVAGDGITNDTTPTISGTGTPGDKITVTTPTGEVITTTVDQNGNWSATPTQALPAGGPQNVSVTATDPAGNVSPATQVPVTIDTTPPAAPAAVLAPASDSGVAGDGITNDTTPTISGTGTPGDKITVTTPTGEVITTTVDQNGNWSATPTQALPAGGPQNVSVTATDPAGNVSPATQVPVTIDTTPPAAPAADVAASSDTGSSNTDNITSDTTPTISGTGTPGDTITVTMPGTNEVVTAIVDSNGNWSATPTQALPAGGPQNVSVTATDPAGNVSPATQVPVTIDTTPPAAPAAVLAPASDSGVAGDGITNDTTPTISGTGTPGDTITVTTPTGEVITTTVDQNGNWSATPTQALPAGGPQNVSVTATDPAGNVSPATQVPVTIDTTPPAAPAAVLAPASDSGVAGDGITNDTTPTISGTGTPGDTITVTMPGTNEVVTAIVDSNGNWSATPTQALPAGGPQNVSVTATDPAGNVSPATQVPVTIDTTPPAAPAAVLAPASDSGVAGDGITNDTTPTISGTGTPGDKITVTTPTGEVITTTVDQNGNWSATPTQALPAGGPQNVSVTATDPAGNVSPATQVPVTIDTTPPAAPAAVLAPASDSGVAGDGITNDTTPTISGTGTPGDTITVTTPTGEVITTTVDQNGNWSATPTQALPAGGPQNVSVTATDPAGNVSPATQVPVTIDTTPPAAPAAVLAPASDSGVAGDGITNDTTPTISGTGTPGDTITVTTPTGEVITTTVDQNGNWSATPTQALPAGGPQNVSVTATDPAGNVSPATQVPVTIDTTAPSVPTVTSSTSNSLHPVISGGASLATGDTLTVTVNGATYIVDPAHPATGISFANGTWSIDTATAVPVSGSLAAFVDGQTYSVTATASDAAGNTSAQDATSNELTINTSLPSVAVPEGPVVNSAEATSNGGTPVVTSLPPTAQVGDTITTVVTKPDGTTLTLTRVLDANDIANGSISQNIPTSDLTQDGNWTTSTTLTPQGGTVGQAVSGGFMLDATPPAAPAADVAASSDTGASNTDNITSDTTPTISGSGATPGDTITVTMPGTNEVVTAIVDSNGNWSATPTQALPAGGPQNVSVTATDPAGNVSPATQVPVTIDTTAPAAPAADVAASSDTGSSNTDNVTSDTTPTISGSGATPGDKITVTTPTGEVITTTVDQNGNWSATPTQALPAGGPQNVSVTATDPAGNVSPATQVPVTIDTTAPAAPAADVAASSDTGSSNTDNVTSDTTPTISGSGATPGDKITVTMPGTGEVITTTVDQNGNWSATPTQALPAGGPQNVSVTATDPAGNVSPATQVPVTIDTTPPAAPAADVAASSDTGSSNTDNITSDTTPTISGSGATPGDKITVTMPGTNEVVTAIVDSNGNWSATPTQALPAGGPQNVSVTATDPAGNVSPATTVPVTIDTTAPAAPAADVAASSDTGSSNTDNITSDTTPTISGSGATPGDKITVTMPGTNEVVTAIVDSNGNWSATPTQALPAGGPQNVSVTATDPAGNVSPATTVPVTIDTTAPAAPAADVAASSDTGSSNTDNITSDTTPTISGTGTPGDTITVTTPTGEVITTTVDQNGNWSATPTQGLSDGPQNVSVTATDPAGNVSPATQVPVTIDTTAPAVPTVTSGTSNTLHPVISGTATVAPGETLTVTVNGATYTVVPNAQGQWSIDTASAAPSSGTLAAFVNGQTYSVTATTTDAAGNSSTDTSSSELTINTTAPDTTPPAAPVLTLANDNVAGGTVGSLSSGATTNDNTPTFTFTAEPGSTVKVYDGSTLLGTATEDPNNPGVFTFTPSSPLSEGAHSINATSTDAANNTSQPSNSFPLVVDTGVPAASGALTAVSGNDSGTLGDNITNDSTPAVSGTTEPNATVSVVINGQTYTTTADANGAWSVTASNLGDGTYTPAITVTDAAGNSTTANGTPFTVDATAPVVPTVVSQTTGNLHPVITGTATVGAGETLTVTVNGATFNVTVSNGTWSLDTATATASSGLLGSFGAGQTYSVTAKVTDAAGNLSTDTTSGEVIITGTPGVVGQLATSSDSGVQGDSRTNDTTPTITGTGVPGETVKLYAPDGTTLLGTATVASDGTWTITPTTPLADGTQNLVAKSFAPGNSTPDSSATIPVVIDTAAAILITSIAADAVAATGNGNFSISERGFNSSTYVLDSTVATPPVISGTATNADVGSVVTITLNSKTYTTTVQSGGTWSYTLSDADAKLLNHGNTYAITATVADAAGNTALDNNNGLDVNIAPPDVPTVVNQFNLTTLIPTISGTANKIDNNSNTITLQTGDILTVVLKDSAGVQLATYTLTVGANNVTTGTGGTGVNLNTELSYDKTTGVWTLGAGNGIPANVFTHAGAYNVEVTTSVPNGAGRLLRSDISSSEITITPTAPIIDYTAWSTTNTTSDLTGVQEALYNRNQATVAGAGTVDNRLYYSEASTLGTGETSSTGPGTMVRVQLPSGTGAIPVVAGDLVKISWGDAATTVDITITAANITAKYVDVFVPFSVIDTQTFGNVVISAQLVTAGSVQVASNSPSTVTAMYVFDLPLANTGNTTGTGDNFGFQILGRPDDNTGYQSGFGNTINMIGDVNGDGFDDMVVSAGQNDLNSTDKSVFVVFGQSGAQNINLSAVANGVGGFQVTGVTNSIVIVAGHGDYNNDGLDDFTISMGNGQNTGGPYMNFVVFGKTNTADLALASLNTTVSTNGFMLNIGGGGTAVSDYTGTNMNFLGDLNGDGYEDLGIYETVNGMNWNYQVVYGNASGVSPTTMARIAGGSTTNNAGYILGGTNVLGYGRGAVGADINGDGYNDVIAELTGVTGSVGTIDVYFGGASGLSAMPTATTSGVTGTGYRITGLNYGTGNIDHAFATADINGDGLIDIVASSNDTVKHTYVFFGKTDSTSFNATALSTGTSPYGFQINGIYGQIAAVGDFNGDGLGDLVVTDKVMDTLSQTDNGGAWLIYGKTSSTAIEISNLQVSEGFRIDGVNTTDYAGSSVSAGGDINGDGFADLIISSPVAVTSGTQTQTVGNGNSAGGIDYVVFGGPSNINSLVFQASNGDVIGTSANDTINGTSGSNQLIGGVGNDVITGLGGADVMYGGEGNDTFVLNADNIATLARNTGNAVQDIARIDGGTGIDSITFAAGTLDMSQIRNAAIENIERFNLTGTGALKLNLLEVLNSSELSNAFNTTNGWAATSSGGATGWGAVNRYSQVVVDGTATNDLYLADGWANIGTVTNNLLTYKVLQSTTAQAQVLVDNRVVLHIPPLLVSAGTELENGVTIAEAASSGTDVKVSLADTGAAAGDTLTLLWGGQTITYTVSQTDVNNGYASINVTQSTLTTETPQGTAETVVATVTLTAGSYTASSPPASVRVDFTVPTAPTISATAWAATGAGNTSSMTGIQEAYYDRNSTTFSTTVGTVDNRLYYSEASSPTGSTAGTVIRVQLPTTGTVPTVAGDKVIVTWGGQSFTSAALTATDITNKYLDVTIPYSTISAQSFGTVTVTAQIQSGSSGNLSGITTLTPNYVFDLPLANTGGVVGDNFGWQINGRPGDNIGGKGTSTPPGILMVGDVNGDGFDDMVIGAGQTTYSANGAAFVVFGSSAPQNVDLSTIAQGNSSLGFMIGGLSSGNAISLVIDHGDFNDDGLDDLSFSSTSGASFNSYIVYGKTNTATVQVSSLGTTANNDGLKVTAAYGGLNNLGDLNGDGIDDWGSSTPTLATWRSYQVTYGTSAATSLTVNASTNNFLLTSGDYLYNDFAQGADVNGDGYNDLILRATSSQDSNMPTQAEIYFGSASGLNASQNASQKYVITGLGGFQGKMIGTGDINGDGKADMVMSTGGSVVYVNYGKSDTTTYNMSTLTTGTNSNGFVIQGSTSAIFDQAKVVGDFNGDGLDDIVIGQTGMSINGAVTGGGYLIYGKTSSSVVQLTNLQVSEGFRIDGALAGNNALTGISGGGDINGDGFDDLIVSSPTAINTTGGAGQTSATTAGGIDYIIFGGPSILNPLVFQASNGDLIGTTGNDTLTGTSGSNQLVGGVGDDLIIGGGGADVMYGGQGNDTFQLNADNLTTLARTSGNTTQDVARIEGGNGIDTIKLDGSGLTFDLTATRNLAINSVENLDITGSGANTVKLSLTEVLDLGQNNLFNVNTSAVDTRKQLMVTGDAGDTVQLTDLSNWTLASGTSFVSGGHTYDVYNHNTAQAQLLIDHQIVQANHVI